MGASGAYGGSGRQEWNDVRDLFDQVPPGAGDAGDGGEGGDGGDGGDTGTAQADEQSLISALSAVAGALADALAGEDTTLAGPPSGVSLGSLLPRRHTTGGGTGGGTFRGESAGSGRSGGGSRRSVARSAARGGAALGGAYALRSGDRAALAEIGLDLDELRGLGPRSQCARILDAVLGEGGHPDETALRTAAAEQLKAIVMQENPPSEADALRGFIAAFVFQLGLVELRSDLAKGVIDVSTALKKEGRIRRYIETRVSQLQVPTSGKMSIANFSAQAYRLVREAINLLRAR